VYGNVTVPVNGSNITEDGGTILVQGVCRSFAYTIIAQEHDGICATSLTVVDPEFSFGADVPGSTIVGLGAPNGDIPPPKPLFIVPYVSRGTPWWFFGALIAALLVCILLVMLIAVPRTPLGSRLRREA
jgi:hypothetical protein